MRINPRTRLIVIGAATLTILAICTLLWYDHHTKQVKLPPNGSTQKAPAKLLRSVDSRYVRAIQEDTAQPVTDQGQDETTEIAEKKWWNDLTTEEWKALNELLLAMDTSDKESLEEGQAHDDEAARQAEIARWRQEVQNLTTSYRDLMDKARAMVASFPNGPEIGREKKSMELKRKQLLCDSMSAIFRYVTCSGDYSGVNAGGWVDDIWGYYVKVQIYPPSEPDGVP